MNRQNRRAFLQASAATALTAPFGRRFAAKKDAVVAGNPAIESLSPAQSAPRVAANEGKKPLRLGLIIGIGNDRSVARGGWLLQKQWAELPLRDRPGDTHHVVRAIQDVGLDNQGVNFDLANLILYGKEIPSTPLNSSARMSRESTRRMGCGRRTRGNLARRSPSARAKWIFRELSNGRGSSTIAARSPLSGRFPDRSKWRTFAMRRRHTWKT